MTKGHASPAIALTGSTGFVGSHVLDLLTREGVPVRALTRRDQPERIGVTWVPGALDDPAALAELVRGADAVVHIAGVVSAPDAAGFTAGNVAGTWAVLDATEQAGIRRFVHISSLSAREPQLSMYGASKLAGEQVVTASALEWDVVRPPAVYGPRDTEMFEMFAFAKRGFLPLPPAGRLSIIHAADLARLIVTLATRPGERQVYEPDDGHAGGWSHRELARMLGRAVGRQPLAPALPKALIRLGARLDGLWRGPDAKLTADRAGYLCHPDWVAHADRQPPHALWQAKIDTPTGLIDTARWYRDNGWL